MPRCLPRCWAGPRASQWIAQLCLLRFQWGYAYMGSAGYVCLVTELVDGESDFFAVMLAAIAFAALMGWPSCIVADCPAVPVVLSVFVLYYAALSEVLCRFLGAC